MNSKALLLLITIVLGCSCANWAVLVAGSNTWYNYRHQADVFHAYQMLVAKGFEKDNIITLAYDDIANNSRNPFPGKVFNKPSYAKQGQDVYAGVTIDYKGDNVSPQLFLDVLEGNRTAVNGKGSGKVLSTNPSDNVFMFFSDHGAPNLIAFPNEYLYADKLLATFERIKGKFNKFVFYLETCESGSMFVNLPTDSKIYALSAANPTESSWGTYCSPDDVIQGKHIGTCLGDLFSVKFIEHSQENDLTGISLQSQFELVRTATTLSHVMQWGDVSYTSDSVSSFMNGGRGNGFINLKRSLPNLRSLGKVSTSIDSRLMKIKILMETHKREQTAQSQLEVREEMREMQRLDDIFFHVADELKVTGEYSPRHMDYECMRTVMDYHTNKCGRLSDYGLMFAKYYADACHTYKAEKIIEKILC